MKAPNPQGQNDRTTRLMTAGRCGTDVDANRLGVILLLRGERGRPARNTLHLGHLAAQTADRRKLVRMGRLVQGPPSDWAKVPSDFNQAQWMPNHTALLNKRIAEWELSHYSVAIEGQNSFQLRGKSVTLAGKPDLITQRDGQAVIVDVKNGQDSPSHVVQVIIYLYAIPRALERYRTLKLRGQATYLDHTVRIPAEAVDDQFMQNLRALIRRLAADQPSARVPSRQECRFCDISAADCPERVDEPTSHQGETLDL